MPWHVLNLHVLMHVHIMRYILCNVALMIRVRVRVCVCEG